MRGCTKIWLLVLALAFTGYAAVAAFPFSDDFEASSTLSNYWTTYGSDATCKTGVNGVLVGGYDATIGQGVRQLTMDKNPYQSGVYCLNEAAFSVNMQGQSNVLFSFMFKRYNNYLSSSYPAPAAGPATHVGHSFSEALWVSTDSVTWTRFVDLSASGKTATTHVTYTYNLDSAFTALGLTYGSKVHFKFSQYGYDYVGYQGFLIDQIQIMTPVVYNLTVQATAGGTATPNGSFSVSNTTGKALVATPSSGYNFLRWSTVAGMLSSFDSLANSVTVYPLANTTIQAIFAPAVVHKITTVDSVYSYANHFYTPPANTGVRMEFKAPAAGYYDVQMRDTITSHYKYFYQYPSNAFSSSSANRYGYGTLHYYVKADSANQSFWFLGSPYNASDTLRSFVVSATAVPKITISHSGNGNTAPVADTALLPSTYITIRAYPDSAYRLDRWSRIAGTWTVTDSTLLNPYLSVSNTLAAGEIRALFVPGTIYPLTQSKTYYNYNKNYFTKSPENGVWFKYTATSTGLCAVIAGDSTYKYNKTLYSYGEDASFSTSKEYVFGSDSLAITQSCESGHTYYFMVKPYSTGTSISQYFHIRMASANLLTVSSNSGNCTVLPLLDTLASGFLTTISATGSAGWHPSVWRVTSGTASITDSLASSTTLSITSNVTIQQQCTAAKLVEIPFTLQVNRLNRDFYDVSPANGIRYHFTNPTLDPYFVRFGPAYYYSYHSVYSYGNDVNFNTMQGSSSYLTSLRQISPTAANQDWYFKVIPYSSSYWSDSIRVQALEASIIQMGTATGGTGTLGGYSVTLDTVPRNEAISLGVTVQAGYRFNGWTVTSGTATIADSMSTATTVIPKSLHVTLTPKIVVGQVYPIGFINQTFGFNRHYYEIDPSYGVRLSFTPTAAGPYVVRTTALTYYLYRYLYDYGSNSNFATYSSSNYQYGQRDYSINVATVGASNYFKVTPYYSSSYPDSFQIQVFKGIILSTDTAGKGTATIGSSYGAVKDTLVAGDTAYVYATTGAGHRFDHWTVNSGSCKLRDSLLANTRVYNLTDDCKVKAIFLAGQVYPLGFTDQTFRFSRHYYEYNPGYGIRFSFTPVLAGPYFVRFTNLGNTNTHRFYDYSADANFGSYSNYQYQYTKTQYQFNIATAGASNYFLVNPYSSSYYNDSIQVRILKGVILSTDTSGYGSASVNSTVTTVAKDTIAQGDTAFVRAYPGLNTRFDHWSVSSGLCSLRDSMNWVTVAKNLNNDCVVKAIFVPGSVYPITQIATPYSPMRNYYSQNYNSGVRFVFTAPAVGTYTIALSSVANKYLYPYDSDATFSNAGSYLYGSGVQATTVNATTAGQQFYYKVIYNSYADSAKPFTINWSQTSAQLTVASAGNGTISPSGYNPAWIGVPYPVSAAGSTGYRFSVWSLDSGLATIEQPSLANTFVTLQTGAKVTAHFVAGVVYPLSMVNQTFNYQTNYYSDPSSAGIRMKWTPPDSSWYYLDIKSLDGHFATMTYYGQDSLFASPYLTRSSSDSIRILFKGNALQSVFLKAQYSSTDSANHNFQIRVQKAPLLNIRTSSQGRVMPEGIQAMLPGMDTSALALPWGGFMFEKWVKLAGSVTIADPLSASTRFQVGTDSCAVEAHYVLDPNTHPQVNISDINITNHPDVCVSAAVTDSASGRSIMGLDTSNFRLWQDGTQAELQVTTVQLIGGVSVVLVVDESGSMGGTKIVEAQASIRSFINAMGPMDRTAIVGFTGGSATSVRQVMTSNKTDLLASVNLLDGTGGSTNILRGTMVGLQQLVGETNPSSVIVFSDGQNGSESTTLNQVVAQARSTNTTIYSIGIVDQYLDPLKNMADSTGGKYTFSPTAAGLSSIYAQIRSEVQARYVVCYRSDDVVFDGDVHTVILKTNFLTNDDADTVTWNESNKPPVIWLTPSTDLLVGANQPPNTSITLRVFATDEGSISKVKLFMRTSDTISRAYTEYTMTHVQDSLYEYVIPAYAVLQPGFDFYAVATDNNGMVGKTPNLPSPGLEPYTIPVGNQVPVILMAAATCADTSLIKPEIFANISDADGTFKAVLFYKKQSSVFYSSDTMTNPSGDDSTWVGGIPLSFFRSGSLDYYIRAIDNTGASARNPLVGSWTLNPCLSNYTLPPVATRLNPQANPDSLFLDSAVVRFRSWSDTTLAIQPVTLYYTLDGSKPTTASTSIASGDSLVFKQFTVVRMFAQGTNADASSIIRFVYVPVDTVKTPVVKRLDWVNFPDSLFVDSLRLILRSPSDTIAGIGQVRVFRTLDGSLVDTNSAVWKVSGDTLIVYGNLDLVAMATAVNYQPSDTLHVKLRRAPQVDTPVGTKRSSLQFADTLFQDSVCVVLTDTTAGARLHYTLDGSVPDTSVAPWKLSGDSVCVQAATHLVVVGTKQWYKNSELLRMTLLPIPYVATPVASPAGTHFNTYVKVSLSVATPGATIYYTLDGSTPTIASPVYSVPLTLSKTTVVKAFATKTDWLATKVALLETYTKNVVTPQLAFVDTSRNALPAQVSMATDSMRTRIRLLSIDDGLTQVAPRVRSKTTGDSVTLAANSDSINVNWNYFVSSPLLLSTRSPVLQGDAVLSIAPWDTLYASWSNITGLAEKAYDTLFVRPSPVTGTLRFGDAAGKTMTQYEEPIDSARVFFMDQIAAPGVNYTVHVTVVPHVLTRKIQVADLSVQPTGKEQRFGLLFDLWPGDTIKSWYQDPIDGELVQAQVLYGTAMEISGVFDLLDSTGKVITADWWYNQNSTITMRLKDDRLHGLLPQVKVGVVAISADSIGHTFTDNEVIILNLQPGTGSTGEWTGSFTLKEQVKPTSHDSIVGVRFQTSLTASVQEVLSDGTRGGMLAQALHIARPDLPDEIHLVNAQTAGEPIVRATQLVSLHLSAQDYSLVTDTVLASVQCRTSGDIESGLRLVDGKSGDFLLVSPLQKGEGKVVKNDGHITCAAHDILVASYRDPIYGTLVTDSVSFADHINPQYRFVNIPDTTDLDSLTEVAAIDFGLLVGAVSPTLDKVDTIWVGLRSNGGDSLVVPAVETGVYTSRFLAQIPFTFVAWPVSSSNKKLEQQIQASATSNRALIRPYLSGDSSALQARDSVVFFSAYVPVLAAEIYDLDRDGRADAVRIHFSRIPTSKPSTLDSVYWNAIQPDLARHVAGADLHFMSDSTWIEATLEEPFLYGLTAAQGMQKPYVLLPNDARFAGQSVPLIDRVGAVVVKATKSPGVRSAGAELESNKAIPDTLRVTLSEPLYLGNIGSRTAWNELFLVSTHCDDSSNMEIGLLETPVVSSDSLSWTLVIARNSPLVGNCIKLDTNASYVDGLGNAPGQGGVELLGSNGSVLVHSISGYPAVAGAGYHGSLQWIPPVGWGSGVIEGFIDPNTAPSGYDDSRMVEMPDSISAVKVATTSPYVADVFIYAQTGEFVNRFFQSFGYHGEQENEERANATSKGRVSYLAWNMRDSIGRRVGSGAYIWKIVFRFPGGAPAETMFVKTGVVRK